MSESAEMVVHFVLDWAAALCVFVAFRQMYAPLLGRAAFEALARFAWTECASMSERKAVLRFVLEEVTTDYGELCWFADEFSDARWTP